MKPSLPFSKCPYRSPRAVSEAIKDIIKNKTVCELGCAEGDNLVFMSRFAKIVKGLELDKNKCDIAQSRGLDVMNANYRDVDLPDADVYYFWPNNGPIDNEYLVHKILANTSFNGTIVVAADFGFSSEVPSLKKYAKLGYLMQVPFDEGSGHRENGIFLLAIIEANSARQLL